MPDASAKEKKRTFYYVITKRCDHSLVKTRFEDTDEVKWLASVFKKKKNSS